MKPGGILGTFLVSAFILAFAVGYFFPNYYRGAKGVHLSSHGFLHMIPIYIGAALITFIIYSIISNIQIN